MAWKSESRTIVLIHRRYLKLNPHHTQRMTARELGLTEKQVHMALRVRENLKDPEIAGAHSLDKAFKILLEKNKARKKVLVKFLVRDGLFQ